MSRYRLDPPDDDAYDIKYDGTDCADCGRPAEAWLCESCSDQRDSWAAATALRMATATNQQNVENKQPAVVEVALVPVAQGLSPMVHVALVPIQTGVNPQPADGRFLKRMAKAILSADLSNIQEVA